MCLLGLTGVPIADLGRVLLLNMGNLQIDLVYLLHLEVLTVYAYLEILRGRPGSEADRGYYDGVSLGLNVLLVVRSMNTFGVGYRPEKPGDVREASFVGPLRVYAIVYIGLALSAVCIF